MQICPRARILDISVRINLRSFFSPEIDSLGGNYGVFPREDLNGSREENLDHEPISGSVFWFTVPLIEPTSSRRVSSGLLDAEQDNEEEELEQPRKDPLVDRLATTKLVDSMSSLSSVESVSRPKRPLDSSNMTFPITKKSHSNQAKNLLPPLSPTRHAKSRSCPEALATWKKSAERTKCILVIDDSITIRKALSKGFTRFGFKVDEAENGLQGFNLMKANTYDLVLCDFLMPIMDGKLVIFYSS